LSVEAPAGPALPPLFPPLFPPAPPRIMGEPLAEPESRAKRIFESRAEVPG
jgi:hypothetical protein